MERFINILVVDNDLKNQKGLKEILSGGGNNILLVRSTKEANEIIHQKEIGILLINIDQPEIQGLDFLKEIKENSNLNTIYKLALTANSASGNQIVKGLSVGAVDYITLPFNPNLVLAKIDVLKSLYYKDQRISQLLNHIFPAPVLQELNANNKFDPRRIENGVVMFTDLVDFSLKSKNMKPIRLLKKLEHYFTEFDDIMKRYDLEKIKTIGDAYMAIGGVTENTPHPALRACLAALEIRDFMYNEREVARAFNRDTWEIRIGLHMGPLVAGIIGTDKISFDVWGDTVNIASRAERDAKPGGITITKPIAENVKEYFQLEARGETEIHKRGGKMFMYYLNDLRPEYCLFGDGKVASTSLREICGLIPIDFKHMRIDIINRLKALLPENVVYHDIAHTLNVEKAVERYAKLEGLDEESILLLRTAALYHDSGFILSHESNEEFAIKMARNSLPRFGFNEFQIEIICNIIRSTSIDHTPVTLMEKILCDADHDYLGRADYYSVVNKLRIELENYGIKKSEEEWVKFQINYLENVHRYHTQTAKNIRVQGKKSRIKELKDKLLTLQE